MDAATRFPEAIPLRKITSQAITKALLKFFTLVGLPRVIQSDQGSNFMSKVFNQVITELGIEHVVSSPYHPESQGALERYHQTLKTMIRTYCQDHGKDWDNGIPFLLFATREVVQESLGFSPFELVFGHRVRGPLQLLKEKLLADESEAQNLLTYVTNFKDKLHKACEMAKSNLENTQASMKTWYDKKARKRSFKPGDQVLLLLPTSGHSLQAKYCGPYTVHKKVGDVDYVVNMPDKRKQKQLCHVNMMKEYLVRETDSNVEVVAANVVQSNDSSDDNECGNNIKLKNSEVLDNLNAKLCHLSPEQQDDIANLIYEYSDLFPDVPTKTHIALHDVNVGDAKPIKQHPYRVNPIKREILSQEVKFMLENEIIEGSHSEWSSPCLLVPKPDKTYRFCTDFRKVNNVTKSDSYPIPRMEDCIDNVSQAKYVSKFDLLKGYWQVPLTPRAKEVSAFVTPDGFYQYKVTPFGMKNSGATFQRMMNNLLLELEGCDVYVDDVVIYSVTWKDHVERVHALFQRLRDANLSVNLAKCDFGKATVTYLGHVVGQGQVKPVQAKVESILTFPRPQNKRELMRFLGTAGYYRKFCQNFSIVAHLLQTC